MRRNRSVRTLPLDNLNLLKHPLPEKLYFGEEITKDNSVFVNSDDSDVILTSVKDLGNSKSSSSSLSWGEDFKSEASKQLHDELERMDKVLRGLEPIPSNYDQEEYKEWMDFFPNLCVLGTKIGTPVPSSSNHTTSPNKKEEIYAIHPEVNCDNSIKESVITKPPKIILDDGIDINNYLKVSSVGESKLPRRQSLISSQISSSKWLKDDDYNSLPFLPTTTVKNVISVRKGILKNSLVLPPIETNQFRSISATPRRESKSLSALSMKNQKYSRTNV